MNWDYVNSNFGWSYSGVSCLLLYAQSPVKVISGPNKFHRIISGTAWFTIHNLSHFARRMGENKGGWTRKAEIRSADKAHKAIFWSTPDLKEGAVHSPFVLSKAGDLTLYEKYSGRQYYFCMIPVLQAFASRDRIMNVKYFIFWKYIDCVKLD